MKVKNILATSLLLTLVGCGGSDGGGDSKPTGGNGGNGGDVTNPPATSLIDHWSLSKITEEINKVNVSSVVNGNVCGTTNKPTVETSHFTVGFLDNSTRYSEAELAKVAKMSQAGFNELLAHTKLNPSSDLNISSSDKWVVCYSDDKSGNGTGYPNMLAFSPTALDVYHEDFSDGYILAKHELFHTIQAELLDDTDPYEHLPRWFQEGTAELFAGRAIGITSHTHSNFLEDSSITPIAITTYDDELDLMSDADIDNTYRFDLYDLYHNSVNYFVDSGMGVAETLDLIRDSQGGNFEYQVDQMQAELKLPVPYMDLRDDTNAYEAHVVKFINSKEIKGSYVGDASIEMNEIFIAKKGTLDIVANGTISRDQSTYAFVNNVQGGQYDIYAGSTSDAVYGAVPATLQNGSLGTLTFDGVPEADVED